MSGILKLIVALIAAAILSQFPAFSDQYVQRLGGQVDALTRMAEEFDVSAERAGLTRNEALAELSGTEFRDAHGRDVVRNFQRLDHARADLQLLRLASPLERMALPHRLRDPATLTATWGDFRPALPLTPSGLIAAGIGFALGWILTALIGRGFRPRREVLGWR